MACSDSNSTCSGEKTYIEEIKLSNANKPFYNVIVLRAGDDITMSIPINNSTYVNSGYNLTIYDQNDGTEFASTSINGDPEQITIEDYNFGSEKAVVVIEDRSDLNNIDVITTIAYIFFKERKGGQPSQNLQGTFNYIFPDDSTQSINYYTTSFEEVT